ncbi:hypothetical protein ACNQ1H_03530 [Enterobacter cloacae complex sp.6722787]|uniref:hypothetical protein n=1 Tax=Enterobacter cloacae complex TaxID=354276 RepID=UPI00209236DF|nr:hypothetical protein [Enterobacter hormaechei]MCU2903476.1 hypothetical protein [Enterobacter hormaechei subsp. steigerwaltii]EKY3929525.1 hypothetical protein [Enterobacter hormaechei]ELJ5802949.1 hypothetical protein [Enterobacter hormaechei]MCO5982590.1 hypothetical protein [Enterobacter hormaechei]MCS0505727.1 hypothetical protein [Enterobacter hormaechei]
MTNISAVEKMAESMQQMEESSPRVAALQYCLKQVAEKVEEAEKRNSELEARCAALAAENAGLKSAIEKHADSYIMCGYCRTERDGKNDDVCEVLDSTPATDAFLAEVRAQGVDELAELNITLACHEANRSIAESWRESARFAKDHAAQLRKGVQS